MNTTIAYLDFFFKFFGFDHRIRTHVTLDPVGPDSGGKKVLRGGSWLHGWAIYCGVRLRLSSEPQTSTDYYGFRIARSK